MEMIWTGKLGRAVDAVGSYNIPLVIHFRGSNCQSILEVARPYHYTKFVRVFEPIPKTNKKQWMLLIRECARCCLLMGGLILSLLVSGEFGLRL